MAARQRHPGRMGRSPRPGSREKLCRSICRAGRGGETAGMTMTRLLLFVLSALALVGAIYFYAIHLAAAAIGFLIALVALLAVAFFIRSKISR